MRRPKFTLFIIFLLYFFSSIFRNYLNVWYQFRIDIESVVCSFSKKISFFCLIYRQFSRPSMITYIQLALFKSWWKRSDIVSTSTAFSSLEFVYRPDIVFPFVTFPVWIRVSHAFAGLFIQMMLVNHIIFFSSFFPKI